MTDAVDKERVVIDQQNNHAMETVDEHWDRVLVIVDELRQAIKESIESQVTNRNEIENVRNSIEGIALVAAQKVMDEAQKKQDATMKEMAEQLKELQQTVDDDAAMREETDKDLQSLIAIVAKQESVILEKAAAKFKKESKTVKEGAKKAMDLLKGQVQALEDSKSEDAEKLKKVQDKLVKLE